MNVLVADDDADYRFLVDAALRDVAHVVGAATAVEAVAVAQSAHPDLALVDASMRDAFIAIPQLRGVAPGVRIVLTSIGPAWELAPAAPAAGAVGFLGKDVAPSGLARALLQLDTLVGDIEQRLAHVTRRLPADRTSPAEARRVVGRTVAEWCDDEVVESVVLCLSELVTNAVVHAGSGPTVSVEVRPTTVHVEVRDGSADLPSVDFEAQDDATSGRGLMIVGSVADRWGIRRHSAGGKTVWFDVARRDAPV